MLGVQPFAAQSAQSAVSIRRDKVEILGKGDRPFYRDVRSNKSSRYCSAR